MPPVVASLARLKPVPPRFQALARLLLIFVVINALVRFGLILFNQDFSLLVPWRLLPAMGIGLLFDLCVGLLGLMPLVWLMAAWPHRQLQGDHGLRRAVAVLLVPLIGLMIFVAFSEFTFWHEFASRFNFIAVEYLVYTSEVLGNIRESYDLPLLIAAMMALTLAVWGLAWRWALAPIRTRRNRRRYRLSSSEVARLAALAAAGALEPPPRHWPHAVLGGLVLPLLLLVACDVRFKEFSDNAQLNELAGNGYFDFWHAFRHNEIDYERFYSQLPRDQALRVLAARYPGTEGVAGNDALPIVRKVSASAQPRRLNVVMVSIESLSASFMGSFGNREGLTPNLDRLATEGMLFTRMYATGTRTVRGLEALSLSIPPTPGHAIVKRPHNEGLATLGGVFEANGFESMYLYGGYGYFDNMNAFFSGNGYTVVDRTALKPDEIRFANIWGVADEDLYAMTLRELDLRASLGKPFFAHVMSTSNHRPFTYPDGRIDIPSRTSREGGVKYTDYAIGEFIKAARERPWFKQTLFVFVADHTHKGRGRQELPLDAFHIPLIVWAPDHIAPSRVDTIASQIDVGPTILGMLGIAYRSQFFGQDILREGANNPRAFMSQYQTVGFYAKDRIVELRPKQRVRVVDAQTGRPAPNDALSASLIEQAISHYQIAALSFDRGWLKSGSLRKPDPQSASELSRASR